MSAPPQLPPKPPTPRKLLFAQRNALISAPELQQRWRGVRGSQPGRRSHFYTIRTTASTARSIIEQDDVWRFGLAK